MDVWPSPIDHPHQDMGSRRKFPLAWNFLIIELLWSKSAFIHNNWRWNRSMSSNYYTLYLLYNSVCLICTFLMFCMINTTTTIQDEITTKTIIRKFSQPLSSETNHNHPDQISTCAATSLSQYSPSYYISSAQKTKGMWIRQKEGIFGRLIWSCVEQDKAYLCLLISFSHCK